MHNAFKMFFDTDPPLWMKIVPPTSLTEIKTSHLYFPAVGEFEVSLKMTLCPSPLGRTKGESVKLTFIAVGIK